MNDDTRLWEVDRMIDEITAPARDGRGRAAGAGSMTVDEVLVRELLDLGAIDWPADDVGDRIAEAVVGRVGRTELPVRSAARPGAHPRRRGPVPSRRWTAGITVAAALVVLVVVAAAALRPSSGPGSFRPSGPVTVATLKMRLVDSTASPFQFVGAGPQTGDLVCVTAAVCYADEIGSGSPTGSGVERTTDGGATWTATADLPDHQQFTAAPLSCPTTEMCMGATSAGGSPGVAGVSGLLQLALTTDGGAHWEIESLTAPSSVAQAMIDQLACASPQRCVVHVISDATAGSGIFVLTTDGGRTWTTASSVTPATPGGSAPLFTLRCDPDGGCIGLAPTGSVQQPATEGITAVRSADGGRTWTTTSTPLATGPGVLLMSCGDTTHCMMAYPSTGDGAIIIATTADGGATWKVTAAPPTWPGIAIAVSCATDEDCFVSAASYTSGGDYDNPVVEATHDGGTTWEPLALPAVDGSPLALVYPLSCPVGDGCIGVGATPQGVNPHVTVPSTLPAPGWVGAGPLRVVISNLPAPIGSSTRARS